MPKIIRFTLVLTVVLALSACNLGNSGTVDLKVEHENTGDPLNTAGQEIKYRYIVTNIGGSPLAGPVIVTDPGRQVTCPPLDDGDLDPNETTICTGTYAITQTDLNNRTVTNDATAMVGTKVSNKSGVAVTVPGTLNLLPPSPLTLTKTANPTTYNQIGQTINYIYIITNTAAPPLNPPFTISDNHLGTPLETPFTCDPTRTTPLLTNETVTCTVAYIITQADMLAPNVINSATASGGGVPASQAASATITNSTVITATPTSTSSPTSNFVPGSTILHQVVKGEWLIQIARCYGANFDEVRNANPQIIDPHFILPAMIVSVPRIGSVSKIYGPPCITSHTVQSGDTWESIALKYNADVEVLKTRNGGALSAGRVLIIPLNSAGGSTAPLPAQPTFTPTATATSTATPTLTFTPGPTSTATATATNTPSTTSALQQAADINPGAGNSNPAYLAEYKGVLYFSADDGKGKGAELWKYDSATALGPTNPSLVWDINTTGPNGSNPSNPAYLTVDTKNDTDMNNDVLYFSADDGSHGYELWKYDSATNKAELVLPEIVPGSTGSDPSYLTMYNNQLYFSANDGLNGVELWRYPGSGSPAPVNDINPGTGSSSPAVLTVYNGALYFRADGGSNPIAPNPPNAGFELWRYVDTPPGTPSSLVANIAPDPKGSFPDYLAVYKGVLYFSADGGTNGNNAGVELWKYVDTPPNTPPSLVENIRTGADSSFPRFLTEFNGALYFQADGGPNGNNVGTELWTYVDTIPPPIVAHDIWLGPNSSFPSFLTPYGGWLYFSANDGKGTTGVELWRIPPP